MEEELRLLVFASLASVIINSYFKDLSEAFVREGDGASQEGEEMEVSI